MAFSRSSWKRVHQDGLQRTTFAFQAHEDKLYVDQQTDETALREQNAKMRSEQVFRKDVFRKDQGRLRFVFQFPDVMTRNAVHAQFPDLKDSDPDRRMSAFYRMALMFPQYVAQG